ncbi:MAG TPA: hypothetical protein VLB02_01020 [Candidatus Paceibacterota bacterium]|nr:hypothetical protein [Candidatus Paceibacterota bacterium]
MLSCTCGWEGVNLTPNHAQNTAHCPKCNTVFEGIPAEDAAPVSAEQEEKITNSAGNFLKIVKALFPGFPSK